MNSAVAGLSRRAKADGPLTFAVPRDQRVTHRFTTQVEVSVLQANRLIDVAVLGGLSIGSADRGVCGVLSILRRRL